MKLGGEEGERRGRGGEKSLGGVWEAKVEWVGGNVGIWVWTGGCGDGI